MCLYDECIAQDKWWCARWYVANHHITSSKYQLDDNMGRLGVVKAFQHKVPWIIMMRQLLQWTIGFVWCDDFASFALSENMQVDMSWERERERERE